MVQDLFKTTVWKLHRRQQGPFQRKKFFFFESTSSGVKFFFSFIKYQINWCGGEVEIINYTVDVKIPWLNFSWKVVISKTLKSLEGRWGIVLFFVLLQLVCWIFSLSIIVELFGGMESDGLGKTKI